ncbi:secretion system protein [Halomicroarcula sp. F28]|uniref:secretion system protein n=1 Tax=Haloarcula salinisoli TaxID=2487746 RepID=UPI001C73CC22|nr:secretion system protein [Halomicroarcula salinisoli]MBX0288076.1 secretion system protein [Halomicroarcula salinisoli]
MAGTLRDALPIFAKLYPWEVDTSDALADALSYLYWDESPETIVKAGYGAGFVAFLLTTPLLLISLPLPAIFAVMLALTAATIHAVHSLPSILAAVQRTEDLGQAPNLIGRIVLRMKIQPSIESAVRFAADTGEQPLYDHLNEHIERSIGSPRSGLLTFAEEWGDEFPSLQRSAHLLNTAQDASPEKREETLDRALSAMLRGTQDQMAEFIETIRRPTTALYAFGIMLPLALVALMPAVSVAGISVGIEAFAVVYLILLPSLIVAASVWLLTRRPVAFPPPDVSRGHPDVERPWYVAFGLALLVAGPAAAVTVLLNVSYIGHIAAVGMALGLVLYLHYEPVVEVQEWIHDVENHLVDALYTVGRQVDDSEAVEAAIATAGDRLTGQTGEMFERAAGRQERLHLTVKQAFLGRYGVLDEIPSPRARATAALLAIAAEEGQPAGETIVSMSDHIEELQTVEQNAKRELSQVTATLQNTAMIFGPVVAGATVALADAMSSKGVTFGNLSTQATSLSIGPLAVVVGIYVLLLSVLLQPLSIGLRHGLDGPLIGYETGKSMLVATPLYVITVFSVGVLV